MQLIAKQAYDATKIGGIATINYDPNSGMTLESFQAVLIDVENMERDGKISITKIHRESSSGLKLVDLIRFTRID